MLYCELIIVCFYFIFSTISGKEPVCSRFDYEEKTLEKIIRQEFLLTRVKEDLEATQKQMMDAINDLRNVDNEIKETLKSMSGGSKNRNVTEVIAFSAYDPQNKNPVTGEIVAFSKAQLNKGDAYNTLNGHFTAPVAGLYQFHAHICNSYGKYIVFAIMENGYELAASTQWDDTGSCGSMSTLAIVNVGESVFLKCKLCQDGVAFYDDINRRNFFSGVLLHRL